MLLLLGRALSERLAVSLFLQMQSDNGSFSKGTGLFSSRRVRRGVAFQPARWELEHGWPARESEETRYCFLRRVCRMTRFIC